jgi:HemY protein
MLMAEIERTEHGDTGRARAWTLRAVRALHDPVWTADGYVSDRWRPVSPVTGRLDAFQWQTPVASLPSDKGVTVESSPFEEAMLAPRREAVEAPAEPPRAPAAEVAPPPAPQDNSPAAAAEPAPSAQSKPSPSQPESPAAAAAPLFRARADLGKAGTMPVPAVIPIVRPPDDPGIDEEAPSDEFGGQIGPPKAQAGGWRGFLSRWGAQS